MRACRCGQVHRGRCPLARTRSDQQRGTATARGYGRAWKYFKPEYRGLLIVAGILPICGARLPSAPQDYQTPCQAAGLWTYTSLDGSALHLHHEPALTALERLQDAIVCDPNRIIMACASCHAQTDDGR